jgi:hypothetical protein
VHLLGELARGRQDDDARLAAKRALGAAGGRAEQRLDDGQDKRERLAAAGARAADDVAAGQGVVEACGLDREQRLDALFFVLVLVGCCMV